MSSEVDKEDDKCPICLIEPVNNPAKPCGCRVRSIFRSIFLLILNDYFSIYFVKRVLQLGLHKRVNVHFVNHNFDEFNLVTTRLQKSGKLKKLSRDVVKQ